MGEAQEYQSENTSESGIDNEATFKMIISADGITSSDYWFTRDDLTRGDFYTPVDVYFQNDKGQITHRNRIKNEKKISNQTLPRLAFQIFEQEILGLTAEEKKNFPVCRYKPEGELVHGIFETEEAFKEYKNTIEFTVYHRQDGGEFVIYCWNVFSTLLFVQECLRRFGRMGDKFVLRYREKSKKEKEETKRTEEAESEQATHSGGGNYSAYARLVMESKNVIFHGAPGTGKSYLAWETAANIVSEGSCSQYNGLSDVQKTQIEFVQFHPSYDYTDFVEGLRPKMSTDGRSDIGFELRDGVFKGFVDKARKNFEDSQKTKEVLEKEATANEAMVDFFSNIEMGEDVFKTISGHEFRVTNVNDKNIDINISGDVAVSNISISTEELRRMLESGQTFTKIKDVTKFFGKSFATQAYSYDFALYKAIKLQKNQKKIQNPSPEPLKNYVFIIDEINRGEISKIFGELFFSIDPGYRGTEGGVQTQYANMHLNPHEIFYIPQNVYIIGTMNDIDRSVDTFDFAMRRRFRFIELKANENMEMLSSLNDMAKEAEARKRMIALNDEIAKTEDLNENYQIGAAYFLKLKTLDFDQLWTDYLEPLLSDYVQGQYNAEEKMKNFANAYGYHLMEDKGEI